MTATRQRPTAIAAAVCLLLTPVGAFVAPGTGNGGAGIMAPSFRLPKSTLPTPITHHADSHRASSSSTSLQAGVGGLAGMAVSALRAGGRSENLALVASGGAGDVADIVIEAYEWCVNLGNPSALVAGAVVATIYENISSGALEVEDGDTRWIIFGKRLTRVLLLSAFAFEVLSIFVTTVSGTMLLSRTLDFMDEVVPVTEDTTPLQFFRENFEFEYLTARITFLQGLLNWLAAIALGHLVPHGENKGARVMNKFIGGALLTTIVIMLAFYNKHMTFYHNYGHMFTRWVFVFAKRFIFCRPMRPMALLYVPSIITTSYYGVKAFFDKGPGAAKKTDDDSGNADKTGNGGGDEPPPSDPNRPASIALD